MIHHVSYCSPPADFYEARCVWPGRLMAKKLVAGTIPDALRNQEPLSHANWRVGFLGHPSRNGLTGLGGNASIGYCSPGRHRTSRHARKSNGSPCRANVPSEHCFDHHSISVRETDLRVSNDRGIDRVGCDIYRFSNIYNTWEMVSEVPVGPTVFTSLSSPLTVSVWAGNTRLCNRLPHVCEVDINREGQSYFVRIHHTQDSYSYRWDFRHQSHSPDTRRGSSRKGCD